MDAALSAAPPLRPSPAAERDAVLGPCCVPESPPASAPASLSVTGCWLPSPASDLPVFCAEEPTPPSSMLPPAAVLAVATEPPASSSLKASRASVLFQGGRALCWAVCAAGKLKLDPEAGAAREGVEEPSPPPFPSAAKPEPGPDPEPGPSMIATLKGMGLLLACISWKLLVLLPMLLPDMSSIGCAAGEELSAAPDPAPASLLSPRVGGD